MIARPSSNCGGIGLRLVKRGLVFRRLADVPHGVVAIEVASHDELVAWFVIG